MSIPHIVGDVFVFATFDILFFNIAMVEIAAAAAAVAEVCRSTSLCRTEFDV